MSLTKAQIFTIRDAEEGDRPFIFSTWLRGMFYGNQWFGQVPKDIFMANYHRVIENLLESPGTIVKVACLTDDKDIILGYSVYRDAGDGSVLDYVFVKQAWRKVGIGKSLVPSDVKAVTHLTEQGRAMLKTKLPNAHFNPFLI